MLTCKDCKYLDTEKDEFICNNSESYFYYNIVSPNVSTCTRGVPTAYATENAIIRKWPELSRLTKESTQEEIIETINNIVDILNKLGTYQYD